LALKEREILLSAFPQISWPMRFLLPCHRDMRFDSDTPTSRLLSFVMPWMKGRWPAWLIRLGLSLCDHLGRGKIIPGTSTLDLASCSEGTPLQDKFSKVCEYSDCWVEDARLVALNARDAKLRDADILTHTKVTRAERKKEVWEVARDNGQTHFTRTLVNPGGPWVAEIARGAIRQNSKDSARLIRGSHIVTKKLFDHEKCYFFQGTDGRIIFAIPYETGFTLIGTTDSDHPDPSTVPECSPEEADYLGRFASQYIKKTISKNEIVWTYSSVRRFYDNGAASATAATRDYVLEFDTNGAPLLNVLGGKITTNRKLSELAVEKIAEGTETWSAGAALPGDEFPVDGVRTLIEGLLSDYSFLTPR
ncbi:MAG: glycerol-3-phosphate dehydrogenase, partial [Roseibium sp.]